MNIYKLNWFNYLHDGIHIEMVQNTELASQKQVNLELHTHKEGLGEIRDALNQLISPALKQLVESLGDPYRFREKSQSGKVSATFKCSPSTFAKKAAEHIERLRPVGKIIDESLAKLIER